MQKVIFYIRQHKIVLVGVLSGLIVAGATSAIVLAAIPGTGGVIHACYRSNGVLANGAVRIIDDATQTCANNETAITWNQTGPQGPAGPPGSSDVGGKIYTKMVNIPNTYDDNNPTTLIDIPDLGTFKLGQCYYDGLGQPNNRKIIFTNTTSHDVNFNPRGEDPTEHIIPGGSNYEFSPNMGVGNTPYASSAPYDYLMNFNIGNTQRVVQILTMGQYIAPSWNDPATGCSMIIQATVSG